MPRMILLLSPLVPCIFLAMKELSGTKGTHRLETVLPPYIPFINYFQFLAACLPSEAEPQAKIQTQNVLENKFFGFCSAVDSKTH